VKGSTMLVIRILNVTGGKDKANYQYEVSINGAVMQCGSFYNPKNIDGWRTLIQKMLEQDSKEGNALHPSPSNTKSIFKLYESEIGALTRSISDSLSEAEKEYPYEWFELAFSTAARNNARSWAYVETILKRWKVQGFKSNNKPKPKLKKGYQDTINELARKRGIILDQPDSEVIDV